MLRCWGHHQDREDADLCVDCGLSFCVACWDSYEAHGTMCQLSWPPVRLVSPDLATHREAVRTVVRGLVLVEWSDEKMLAMRVRGMPWEVRDRLVRSGVRIEGGDLDLDQATDAELLAQGFVRQGDVLLAPVGTVPRLRSGARLRTDDGRDVVLGQDRLDMTPGPGGLHRFGRATRGA